MGEDYSVDAAGIMKEDAPPHFVLIHGISGGAWCWYKIKCLMENCGYKVTCLDLKGAGMDQTDPNAVVSFEDYNQPLIDFLSSLHDHQQVILVGHSAGGLSLSDAIHRFGKKKIKLAVFVAATMLKSGYLTDQDIKDGIGLRCDVMPTTLDGSKELLLSQNSGLCLSPIPIPIYPSKIISRVMFTL